MPPVLANLRAFAAVSTLGWLAEPRNALLAIALLLCLWLWLLVRRRGEEVHRHLRPSPLTPDELGRTVFRVARSLDHRTYRELLLCGTEAAHLLGDDAAAYMEARSPEVLAASLRALASRIPEGATYSGVRGGEDEHWHIEVRTEQGESIAVEVGTVVKVGAAWRIFAPARPAAVPQSV